MKATIVSTTEVVEIVDPTGRPCQARVWEGVSANGVRFTSYITQVQVAKNQDNAEFERDLGEHKPPSAATKRAIDMRMVL